MTGGSPAHALTVSGIMKHYGARRVLGDVSLRVHPGEIVALLGPNGSGKSTLFNILTGVDRADHGKVLVDGVDVTDLPAFGHGRLGIAYLPQEPSCFRGLSLRDNLRLVLEARAPDAPRHDARIAELLAMFGLTDLAGRRPAALSGGQRRRGELARALACDPRYLLVDEPFARLDPLHIQGFSDMLRRMVGAGGERGGGRPPGILITDHNIAATLDLATRAVILVGGVVIAEGPAPTILSDPEIRNAILSPDHAP